MRLIDVPLKIRLERRYHGSPTLIALRALQHQAPLVFALLLQSLLLVLALLLKPLLLVFALLLQSLLLVFALLLQSLLLVLALLLKPLLLELGHRRAHPLRRRHLRRC